MQRTKFSRAFYMLSTGMILLFSSSTPVFANSNSSSDLLRPGLPGRRISGGVREAYSDSCFTDFDQSLVSVVPRTNLGTTAEAHPTIWFSLPETTGEKSVEFQLLNEADDLVYSTQVNIGDAAGLSEFQLPSTAPALAVDENYKWILSLACNNGSQSPVLGLQGWIRRVDISETLANQIAAASSQERVFLYGTAGLWQEQVTELISLRRQNLGDDDLQRAWTSLIAPTGLTSEISTNIADRMSAVDVTATSIRDNRF